MQLLIAVLFALKVWIDPGMSEEEIMTAHAAEYDRAEEIISTNAYHVDEATGIVIVEDGTSDGK